MKEKVTKTTLTPNLAKIKAIGVGGGGCNAINRMVRDGIKGVEFIAINADTQALNLCKATINLQIGERITHGLGCGGDHNLGKKAAEESREEITRYIENADMVFLACGMGGGTGTGGIPIIAEVAKYTGALTIGIVTKPFAFEGIHRRAVAEEGIKKLVDKVDTLIIIPNDRLLELCGHTVTMDSAFAMVDEILHQGVATITNVITIPGFINLDFADVKSVMKNAGYALMSIGHGRGQNRTLDAVKKAAFSPLLDISTTGATGVLFNVYGGRDLTLQEVNEGAEMISKIVHPEANIIFGITLDESISDEEVKIVLIATGFQKMETGFTQISLEDLEQSRKKENLDTSTLIYTPSP
jgi:cell division protein FtsZ